MIQTSQGIVFHTTKYSETSIIAKIYTSELGLQGFIVNGVRKSKSKIKAAIFQPLTIVDIVFYHKENSNLAHIKEIKIHKPFQTLHSDIRKSTVLLFLVEVLYKSIHEHERNQPLFDFISESLFLFDIHDELIPIFHLYFISQLTRHLGIFPAINHTPSTPFFNPSDGKFQPTQEFELFDKINSLLFCALFQDDKKLLFELKKTQRNQLLDMLAQYFQLHISSCKEFKSLEILKTIFAETNR